MPEGIISGLVMVGGIVLLVLLFFVISLRNIIYICSPNEVLIFSGPSRWLNRKRLGYRIVKGGRGFRIPLVTRVDRMDLSNMVIDLQATNAYSKGGIPLTVQGVANLKIAGHEPLLNNAIERFLNKDRNAVMSIAKATLEGSLRGVLATMTPEQVNEDKILFAERLVQEVEQDMTALGLIVDTLKIQNVQDEVKYLDSIGRKKSAEVIRNARIAESKARAESAIRSAENLQRETQAQVEASISMARATAEQRLTEIRTRRDALVAEELAQVNALVARTRAEVDVQKARVEQVRRQLEADIVQPAKAAADAAEEAAVAQVAQIVEEGRARAAALTQVAATLKLAGDKGRELMLVQKLPQIIEAVTGVIAETKIDKLTVIDSGVKSLGDRSDGSFPLKAIATVEQVKQVFGIDLAEKLKQWGDAPAAPAPATPMPARPAPEPEPEPQSPSAPGEEPRRRPKFPKRKGAEVGFEFVVEEPPADENESR